MSGRAILVTGGAGFIGSNIVSRLCARADADVVVCDRLRDATTGKWRNLARHAVADIVAPEEMDRWLQGRESGVVGVVHMGAISSTTEEDVDRIFETNVRLSRRLWDWCAQTRTPLVYASSAATYGDGRQGFVDDNDLGAISALRPLNAYGWSKKLFDIYAIREASLGRAPPAWSGLRFFNVYGPNEYHKGGQKSVLAHMHPRAAAGETVRLFRSHRPDYPDGGQKRDFVWVGDCVDVVEWLLERGAGGGVLNVGSGRARTFLDLANGLFEALGLPPNIEFTDTPPAIRRNYQYFTEADLSRLRALGYEKQMTPLEAGVAAYAALLASDDPYV